MPKEYASLRRRPFLAPVWVGGVLVLLTVLAAIWALRAASTTLIVIANLGAFGAESIEAYCSRPASVPALDAIVVTGAPGAASTCRGAALAFVPAVAPGVLRAFVMDRYRGGRVLVLAAPDRFDAAVAEFLTGENRRSDPAATAYVVAYPRFSRPALLRWPLP